MSWFFFSLLTAIVAASGDAWNKKFFANLSWFKMSLCPAIYSFPILLITFFMIPIPHLDIGFWVAVLISLPLNIVSYFLYMRAIQISPLSLSLPFLAFTPAFIILTGKLVLGEEITWLGGVGILLIVAGGYILNLSPQVHGLLQPFRTFLKEKGSILMCIVSGIFSVGAVVGKFGIVHSDPIFFGVVFFLIQNFIMLVIGMIKGDLKEILRIQSHKQLLFVGMLYYLHILFHNLAISMVEAAYMISIKRLSILFGVIYGVILFHETNKCYRIIGTILMIMGAVIIGMSKG